MTIPFNRFPLLVQIEILSQLGFQEIFLLSLTSEKMRNLIQFIKLKPKKLQYALSDNGIQVSVGFTGDDKDFHHMANMRHVPQISVKERRQVNLGGVKIQSRCTREKDRLTYCRNVKCRCTKKPPTQIWTHVLEYLEKEDDNVLEFLQTHLESLFANQPPSQLKIESTNSLQSSEIIDNVTDTIFSLDELETTEIKHFLTVRPNQKSVEIHSDLTGRPLKRVSKLFKVPGLAIHESGSMTSKYMDNFSGRCLLLFNANVTYSAWTTLIEKWKNKTAYHKLHAVVTRVPRNVFQEFHFGELLFESNALPWDGISRPRNFMFDPRIPSYRSKSIDCSDWFDIQQNGGGKWASIQIINDKIMFFVWD